MWTQFPHRLHQAVAHAEELMPRVQNDGTYYMRRNHVLMFKGSGWPIWEMFLEGVCSGYQILALAAVDIKLEQDLHL